jgi:histidinol-phosphate aminotransferase
MENPYVLPEALVEEWLQALRAVQLNRYPDADAQALKARLRHAFDVPADAEMLLGNGSDELIQMICLTLAGPNRVLLAPEPTFSMYRIIADIAGLEYVGVPLRARDFSLDLDAFLQAIERHQPALVALSYPNNPTGNLFEREAVERVIQASPGVVLLDEAYFHFSGETFIRHLDSCPNLLVMRTLSKMGLAGLRLGILCGAPDWLGEFNKVRLPYNINVLSQVSGEFILRHAEVLDAQVRQIRADRETLLQSLLSQQAVEVWPSRTNFLLMRVAGRSQPFYEALKSDRILLKNLSGSHPLLQDCLRVTVGTPGENRVFLMALQKHL